MPKVNVFGIGAPKCGTTTLYQALSRCSDACVSHPKETFFFNSDEDFSKGYSWYEERYFPHCSREAVVADITPGYGWDRLPRTAQRIFDYNPDSRLIFFIRDPVARLESEWKMCYRSFLNGFSKGKLHTTSSVHGFQEWIERQGGVESILRSSLYGSTINAYLRWFSPSALFVASAEQLATNYNQTMVAILRFLGLDSTQHCGHEIKANADPSSYGQLSWLASSRLIDILPLRVQRRVRFGLRSQWIQRPLRYPSPVLPSNVKDAIYSRVLDDCATSRIDISSLTRLWARQ
jgi:hypothetical protein